MRVSPALLFFLLALSFGAGGFAGHLLGSAAYMPSSAGGAAPLEPDRADRAIEGSSQRGRATGEDELVEPPSEARDRRAASSAWSLSAQALAQSAAAALESGALESTSASGSTLAAAQGAGQGLSIAGIAVDSRGEPVPNARVVVELRRGREGPIEGTSTGSVGRAWNRPGDAEDELLALAQDVVERRRNARSTVTGDGGRFELKGLSSGQYAVSAFAEGFAFDRKLCSAGTPLRLIGRPVGEFRLDVRLPSGEVPERAIIQILGNPLRARTALWTPAEPIVRYSAQSAEMLALVGTTLRGGGGNYVAPFASERRLVDLTRDGAGPHLFVVQPVGQILVTVEDRSGETPPVEPWVKARRVEDVQGPRPIGRYRDGPFVLAPAEPGSYEITAGRGSEVPEVTRTVEVTDGVTPVTIELGEVDRSRFLIVHCRTPSGDPVDDVQFRYHLPEVGGGRSGSVRSMARGLGEYWIEQDKIANGAMVFDGAQLFLAAESARYGRVEGAGAMPMEEMDFVFAEPSQLKVQLTGMGDRTWRVAVDPAPAVESGKRSSQRSSRRSSRRINVPSSGLAHVGFVQPGKIVIRAFAVSAGSGTPAVATFEEVCFSGDCTVTVALPGVHGVELLAPTFAEGTRCILSRLDGAADRPASYQSKLDASQRATFGDVPPGRYSLVLWEDSRCEMMELAVPSPSVTFQSEPLAGFEVARVTPGGVGAEAGVEVGDRLISINGHGAGNPQLLTRVRLAMGVGPSKLMVRRGGADIELDLPQSNEGLRVLARPRSR